MEMSKKQAEFWVALLVLCIIFALAIMLVDFGIKSAILEESNTLRLKIEEWEIRNGRESAGANAVGIADDSNNDSPIPSDVLVVDPSRMEAGNADNGATKKDTNTRARRAQSGRQNRPRTIPGGDK